MDNLIEKLGLNESLKSKLECLMKEKEKKIKSLANAFDKKGYRALKGKDDITRLAVCIEYSKRTWARYQELSIGEDIFIDTMKDITIWCENNGNKGLKNIKWLENHLKCSLFKIGRLQYQIYTLENKHLDYNLLPFSYGDNMIYIHIPQGEKLIYADCIKSIAEAKDFFSKYFSDYDYQYFYCESWLLYEDNWLFMEPSCNILQFQSMFENILTIKSDHQAIERIFGKRELIKARYPENTSLQRSAKNFIINGGKMGVGVGIIEKEYI